MAQYPTIYTDKSGRVITTMHNMFAETGTQCLEVVIDGVHFTGSSFDTLELRTLENCTEEQLKRFTFNKVPVSGSNGFVWELCNCRIDVHIPQIVLDIENELELQADLKLVLDLGKPYSNGGLDNLNAQFILTFGKLKYMSESDGFETSFAQIQKEMMPEYKFKNCFSCHYSDYSPAGSGFFASLMCFRQNKAAYLTAVNKDDFFKLAAAGYIPIQEIYGCEQFEPREKGTGYRGWPFD
jgi:hypothetical protein